MSIWTIVLNGRIINWQIKIDCMVSTYSILYKHLSFNAPTYAMLFIYGAICNDDALYYLTIQIYFILSFLLKLYHYSKWPLARNRPLLIHYRRTLHPKINLRATTFTLLTWPVQTVLECSTKKLPWLSQALDVACQNRTMSILFQSYFLKTWI